MQGNKLSTGFIALILAVATCHAQYIRPELNVILDAETFWRVRTVWETQEFFFPDGTIRHAEVDGSGSDFSWTNPWNEKDSRTFSAKPVEVIRLPSDNEENWMTPDFDDSVWVRMRGPFYRNSGDINWKLVQMRGLFKVEDLQRAGTLTLNMEFMGGVVVYLNGEEVARAYMPEGPANTKTLALPYPQDVYFNDNGQYVGSDTYRASQVTLDVQAKRWRKMEGVTIPNRKLKEGINVLAVALHRAPCDFSYSFHARSGGRGRGSRWAKIGLSKFEMIGQPGAAIVPNLGPDPDRVTKGAVQFGTGPLKGLKFHLRNQSVIQRVFLDDFPDAYAPVRPLRVTAVKNGRHASQFLVGHGEEELGNLNVTVSDLTGPGTIPASAVEIRYSRPDGPARRGGAAWFDTLEDAPPRRVPMYREHGAALQPVWLNVVVPRDAKPGDYTATLTVAAQHEQPLAIPLQVNVIDWTLPDPTGYGSALDLAQSPESVAMAYDVPLWSDRHFQLLDRTFKHLSRIGGKTLYITAIRRTHWGNEHAMVRWVRDEEGDLQPDLSIVERYLDMAMKHMGHIPGIVLYCWEPPESMGHAGGTGQAFRIHDRDILITMYDPDSEEMSPRAGPAWGTAEAQEFWKRLTDALTDVLKKRGLQDSLLFGLVGDHRPTKLAMDNITHGMTDTRWAVHSHYYCDEWQGYKMGLTVALWGVGYTTVDPTQGLAFGWSNPHWINYYPREMNINSTPVEYRTKMENMLGARRGRGTFIQKGNGVRGLGRLGADFWRVERDARGRIRGTIAGRFPETAWGQLSLNNGVPHILGQGEKGAVPTVRSEAFREATQEAQARIYIEKALLDDEAEKRLGQALIDQSRETLDERIRIYMRADGEGEAWFISSDWRERSERLYTLAAEVQAKFGREPVPNLE